MRILLTEAGSVLGAALDAALKGGHQVRTLAAEGVDPMRAHDVWQAVRGVDAVVLTGEVAGPLPSDDLARDRHLLDAATRGTHVLFQAAVEAGVKRLVYCSSLELFARVPDDVYVAEHRRPAPGTDMRWLSRHLAEQVAREFAREFAATVTVLRLGRLVREEDVSAGAEPDLMWLDPRDAATAVAGALGRDHSAALNWTQRFAVYHVCASPPHAKFLTDAARAGLGFSPEHNFAAAWSAAR